VNRREGNKNMTFLDSVIGKQEGFTNQSNMPSLYFIIA